MIFVLCDIPLLAAESSIPDYSLGINGRDLLKLERSLP
jgi:hypothetical protein